jgi:hypothetical protein
MHCYFPYSTWNNKFTRVNKEDSDAVGTKKGGWVVVRYMPCLYMFLPLTRDCKTFVCQLL